MPKDLEAGLPVHPFLVQRLHEVLLEQNRVKGRLAEPGVSIRVGQHPRLFEKQPSQVRAVGKKRGDLGMPPFEMGLERAFGEGFDETAE